MISQKNTIYYVAFPVFVILLCFFTYKLGFNRGISYAKKEQISKVLEELEKTEGEPSKLTYYQDLHSDKNPIVEQIHTDQTKKNLPTQTTPSTVPTLTKEKETTTDSSMSIQVGAFTECLMPGALSSHRHWHAKEDEFLYVLEGNPTLIEDDGPHDLAPGACVCWPAGIANGHCLKNDTAAPVLYFVAGTRLPEDAVTYPDIDLHYRREGGWRHLTHKDGRPYPGWPKETNR